MIFFQPNFVKVLDARHAFHIHMNKCSRLSKLPSKLPTHLTHLETRVARSVLFCRRLFFFSLNQQFPGWEINSYAQIVRLFAILWRQLQIT